MTSAKGKGKYIKGIIYQVNSNLIFVKGTNRRKRDDPIPLLLGMLMAKERMKCMG
jgi:hypothetical protein